MKDYLPWISAIGSMAVLPLLGLVYGAIVKRLDRADDRTDKLFERTDRQAVDLAGLRAKIDACPNCPN